MFWKFWSGRKDRLALALVGVLVLGAGLSVIATLADSVTGTVTKTYEQTWRSPFDILVHIPLPGGDRLAEISDPNALTALPAGISMAQVNAVKQLPGVQLVAPLATVGYLEVGPTFDFPSQLSHPGPGVYRVRVELLSHQSQVAESSKDEYYVALPDPNTGKVPDWTPSDVFKVIAPVTGVSLSPHLPVLVVGVDPEAEAALVGLDRSLTKGEYLDPYQKLTPLTVNLSGKTTTIPRLPVLLATYAFKGIELRATVEELDEALHPKRVVQSVTWTGTQLLDSLHAGGDSGNSRLLLGRGGLPTYLPVTSPFPERWPIALELKAVPDSPPLHPQPKVAVPFRWQRVDSFGPSFRPWEPANRGIAYVDQGLFDASRLSLHQANGTELPMLTYQPAEGRLVLDGRGRPVNPPRILTGGISPKGFLLSEPVMVTNIPSALQVVGEHGINALRVKVEGAEHFTPESIAKVRQVAQEIERQTGLVAEVTMGSSPVDVLIKVPDSDGSSLFGWVEQKWIHKDAAVTHVQQAEFGYSVYVTFVIIVACIYALATSLAGLTARRRELGVVSALGWPRAAIVRVAVVEQAFLALLATLVAVLCAASKGAPVRTLGWTLLAGPVLYLPAILAAGYAAARVSPAEALNWGDTAPGRRVLPGVGPVALSLSSLMGRPGRTLLTLIATALPTSLILVLAFISRHLSGVLYTTVVGQYAAVKVGPIQYAAGLVALAVASVTAFDLIRQNAVDHRNERALLHALGWPRFRIGMTLVAEGAVLGALSGFLGILLGLAALMALYGTASQEIWSVAALVWLIPFGIGLVTGLVSSVAELRTWGRESLAGVGARQVLRFTWPTWAAVAAALLLLVGGILRYALPELLEQARVSRNVINERDTAADLALEGIRATVSLQERALETADPDLYAATIDPEAEAYIAEQRHWVENLRVWRQTHSDGKIARTVQDVALLGTNTARVHITVSVPGMTPETLRTVWVRTADGRWLEHGIDQQVYANDSVTVWYPASADQKVAEGLANTVRQARNLLQEQLHWTLSRPPVFEVEPDAGILRWALGPDLATRPTIINWVEFREPVRIPLNGPGWSLSVVTRWVAYQWVMEASGNHAAEWWREGLTRYALGRTGLWKVSDSVALYRSKGVLALSQLPKLHPGYDLPGDQFEQVGDTAWFFAIYLEAKYGDGTLNRTQKRMGERLPDLRMTGPETFAERDALTISAIEDVTGKSWDALDTDFALWVSQELAHPRQLVDIGGE